MSLEVLMNKRGLTSRQLLRVTRTDSRPKCSLCAVHGAGDAADYLLKLAGAVLLPLHGVWP